MGKKEKILLKVLRGTSDASISFSEMSKYKYEVIIYWGDEDEAFIAEVPELPGCAAEVRRMRKF